MKAQTAINRDARTVEARIIWDSGRVETLMGFSYGPHLRTVAGARACARRHALAIIAIRKGI